MPKVTGLLFQPDMVRAMWRGEKDMTRRPLKTQPEGHYWEGLPGYSSGWRNPYDSTWVFDHRIPQNPHPDGRLTLRCPYGGPGDFIYVRENTWRPPPIGARLLREGADTWPERYYAADGMAYPWPTASLLTDGCRAQEAEARYIEEWCREHRWKLKPSIHMPRRMSRMFAMIESVRIERLQSISEADAIREGCRGGHGSIQGYNYSATPQEHFQHVICRINGDAAWKRNIYVWVLTFSAVWRLSIDEWLASNQKLQEALT